MSWSVRLGRISGIDVYMHLTFLILLGWIGYQNYAIRGSLDDAFRGIGIILAVFGVVILHELGHALAARQYGIATRDITLLPIGGLARLERMPEEPWQELVVAAAGPLVNVIIAAGLLVGIMTSGGFTFNQNAVEIGRMPFIEQMFLINVWLVLFNLIPAFPMDGGRMLRAVLAFGMDYTNATRIAAIIGQGIAFLFGIVGLFGIQGVFPPNPLLIFIALFVWIGAAAEASMTELKAALSGIPVSRAMIQRFVMIPRTATLREVANHVLEGYQPDFPVVNEDQTVAGIICQSDLLQGLSSEGPDASVEKFMRTEFRNAHPNEMLDRAFARLDEVSCPVLPVLEGEKLVGILTRENVGELLMIRKAVKAQTTS